MAAGVQMMASLLDQHEVSSGLRTGKAEAISRHLVAALTRPASGNGLPTGNLLLDGGVAGASSAG
jgi:hypothetical protein